MRCRIKVFWWNITRFSCFSWRKRLVQMMCSKTVWKKKKWNFLFSLFMAMINGVIFAFFLTEGIYTKYNNLKLYVFGLHDMQKKIILWLFRQILWLRYCDFNGNGTFCILSSQKNSKNDDNMIFAWFCTKKCFICKDILSNILLLNKNRSLLSA